jgi:effector-binding domain-containing protein
MAKAKPLLLLVVLVVLLTAGAVKISVEPAPKEAAFSIRKLDEQVVLYTIYRGSYDKIGPAIGKLFALAGQKAIRPAGPVAHAYLNNPKYVSSEHLLTEIRIPVAKDALKHAGALGQFTDVKVVAAMQVAVATKPPGQADPAAIYQKLYRWIAAQGYVVTDAASEIFLTNTMTGDYAKMKTEILVPVEKLPEPEP